MGSTVSKPLDQVPMAAPPKIAAPASPAALAAPVAPVSPAQDPITNCWSCRVLSGTGLIGTGGYVYWTAKRPLKLGYAARPGQIAQMGIGISEKRGAATWAGGGSSGRSP
ncbi:PREDICTED: transmembrane protein 261 [Elephantulus edwardii]|uniref:transmembrane protein 261 n=1 Tax=Elephantulus edwardii TaxID=28737 RepID=UPI0003F07493|nr:PREDICTED: transmembrane protein 261 [Elephantulus edwardii]